jgi:hypothetical protein
MQRLPDMIAVLIRKNTNLKRQIDKLTTRGSAATSAAVEHSLLTIRLAFSGYLRSASARRPQVLPEPGAQP